NNFSFNFTLSIVKQIKNKENKVLSEIRKQCDVDELSIEND
ncbi:hypothetical protein SS7213T_03010, partial [Staphylococcus simiae CCM 7213 = CCUG 51256]